MEHFILCFNPYRFLSLKKKVGREKDSSLLIDLRPIQSLPRGLLIIFSPLLLSQNHDEQVVSVNLKISEVSRSSYVREPLLISLELRFQSMEVNLSNGCLVFKGPCSCEIFSKVEEVRKAGAEVAGVGGERDVHKLRFRTCQTI